MELQCSDLEERYRTRVLYAIAEPERTAASEELDDVQLLMLEWADLCKTAEAADEALEGVKHKFSQITRQQVGYTCSMKHLPVHLAGFLR